MNIVGMPSALKDGQNNFGLFDDFLWFVTAHLWTSLAADSGASVAAAGVGGELTLTTGGTDNNEAYAYTASAFKPAANKPAYLEALCSFAEANTDDANVAFGLASSPGANLIVDDGAGMRASGTVIALYKVDGGTVWRFVTRNGSAVTDSVSTTTAGGSAYQKLSIEVLDGGSGLGLTVVPRVDDQLLFDATTRQPVRHTLDVTGIAAAGLFLGAKAGGANSEAPKFDYAGIVQAR